MKNISRNTYLKNIKKRLQHRCWPVNFAKFFRTAFLRNTLDDCNPTFSENILDSLL